MRNEGKFMLLAATCLSLLLGSCSSGNNSAGSGDGQETGGNQHLLQGEKFIADASLRARSYNTVAVQPEHHNLLSAREGVISLPYEILSAGSYKFCVPEGEGHKVSLEDGRGNVFGRWEAGACVAVPLAPGDYWLHVENAEDATLFIKPHTVTTRPVLGTASLLAPAAAATDSQNRILLDLKKDSLLGLLGGSSRTYYSLTCTMDEHWALWADGTSQGKGTGYAAFSSGAGITLSPAIAQEHFFSICLDAAKDYFYPGDPNVQISQGTPAWKSYLFVFHQTEGYVNGPSAAYDLFNYTNIPIDDSNYLANSLVFADGGAKFKLGTRHRGQNPLNFLDWQSTQLNRTVPLTFTTQTAGVEFHPLLRYGRTTKAQPVPFLLAEEIALFDQPIDKTSRQFPEGTTYWILRGSQTDLDKLLAFDSPVSKIKAIIVGRGVRAHLFAQPGYQPTETMEVVSPPDDAELVYRLEESRLMGKKIGSIFLVPNTNTFSDYEFEHQVIVSGTCVECDLRGFNGSGSTLNGVILSDSNLQGADLSNAILKGAHLEGCQLTQANLKGANLANAFLHGASLQRAELSDADLSSAYLNAGSYTPPGSGQASRDYARATLVGTRMKNTKLDNAHATGADFSKASWWGEGASAMNAILDEAHFDHADLPKLNLRNASLKGAVFSHAVLMNADLSGSSEGQRSFEGTDFVYANLKGTNLDGVNLSSADLSNAFISTAAGSAYVEVLDSVLGDIPKYTFFAQDFNATSGQVHTEQSTVCPDMQYGWCGELTDPTDTAYKWGSPAEPEEPTDCQKQSDGTVTCTSRRHPTQ
jgi:uncharacterized protein YjbI with pentapeptide repeats